MRYTNRRLPLPYLPLLEYASRVWSPYLLKHIKRIESVQKRFTKRLPNISHLGYTERLKTTGLDSLNLGDSIVICCVPIKCYLVSWK